MRTLAACSPPARVRVAAVVAGKLSLALAALPVAELRAAGVGAMPFPGLDHGNGALLALRRRLPLLATYGSSHAGPGPAVHLPERLELDDPAALDRALTLLVGQLLAGAAPELAQTVGALAGLQAASSLRALLLSSTGYGASRLLISWANERGLRVGSMQHGIYAHKDVDDGERRVDVVFGWGEGTVEQTLGWGDPRPRVVPVGVPGIAPAKASATAGPPSARPNRVLLATSSTVDAPLTPAAICEAFVEVIALGLKRLSAAGVEVTLRPHPTEDPARYRRLLDAHGLDIRITSAGSFATAAARADIVISALSSVAFEAAGMGYPVLLWLGGVPQWVRRRHMVVPWAEDAPGMFEGVEDFTVLVDGLLERGGQTFALAGALAHRLAHFAEPFRADRFTEGLHSLAS